jgi:ubiquinone/menaquinone biosynthesis C-methylase UbiE
MKKIPFSKAINRRMRFFFDNANGRELFVKQELLKLKPGSELLDAGCGDQKYRHYCDHLNYSAQDFGQYTTDTKRTLGNIGLGGTSGYKYGPLDYEGNIWDIDVISGRFDTVLCTEVLEHIPYPIETLQELSRVLKSGGTLILTAPSNCLRHMDPYFYTSGFSDRWYEHILPECGFKIVSLVPVGDYYRWLAVEILRTIRSHKFSTFLLLPSLIYFSSKRVSEVSRDSLCMGYHVVATKI